MHRHLALTVVVLAAGLTVAAGSFAARARPITTASVVVLGSPAFEGHGSEGWGKSRPKKVFNGGDLSGLVREIVWTSWGGATAIGYGVHYMFKPQGGYYEQPVLIELRASRLGNCGAGPRAYTRLSARDPVRPDASWGPWFVWAGANSIC